MKAMAASSIGQYERAVHAFADYYRTVELGLVACFRKHGRTPVIAGRKRRDSRVGLARSYSVPIRGWWADLTTWRLTMR